MSHATPSFLVVLADGLLLTLAIGLVTIGAALLVVRRTSLSADLRQLILLHGMLALPILLAIFLIAEPWPVGCVTASCGAPAPSVTGAASDYGLEAAGKFLTDPIPGRPETTSPSAPVLSLVLLLLWSGGAALLLAGSARRRFRLRGLLEIAREIDDPAILAEARRIADRLGLERMPRLVQHDRVPQPAMSGTVRPTVFLPPGFASKPSREREIVFLHELSHARRNDPAWSLAAELIRALFWMHPLVWRAAETLGRLQELATDSSVLGHGIRPSRYAGYLLSVWKDAAGGGAPPVPLTHTMAGDCPVADRIRSLVDSRSRHAAPSRFARSALFALALPVIAALAYSPAALESAGLFAQKRSDAVAELDSRLLTAPALDSLLRPMFIDRMTDRYVAGAAIAVVHDGRLVYAAGFGDREVYIEDPVDPARTIFRIGSITKVLTGIAVMQLVDRGLLDLDADVNDYLPEPLVPAAFGEPVRVRHLLTHTAGFDQIGLDRHADFPDTVRPLGDWLDGKLVRIRPPGRISAYDTYGITLAGHLVEAVSGLEYEDYLQREIFGPLAMHRSGISVSPPLAGDVAIGYGFAGEWEALPWEYMNTAPASTVNSTVTDMARLMIALLSGGPPDEAEGERLLSEASKRAMLSPQFTNHPDQPGYGYTFFEDPWNGIERYSHAGSMAGYSAMLTLVPDHDLGVFLAYNQESAALIRAIFPALFSALFPDAEPPALRDAYRGDVDLERFAGTYANNVYNHGDPDTGWKRRPVPLTIGSEEKDDAGVGSAPRLTFDGVQARPVAPLTFQRDDGVLLTFRENDRGEITHMIVRQAVYERLDDAEP